MATTLQRTESSGINPTTTSFTTGNGDGLTFDPYSLSIFDEIQLIIEGREQEIEEINSHSTKSVAPDEPDKDNAPKVEPEFLMEDVPDNLKTTSILLEVIEQMEALKENLQPLKERDADLRGCIQQIKRSSIMADLGASPANTSTEAGSPDTSMITSSSSALGPSPSTQPANLAQFGDRLNSCSYTLESLINQLRASLDSEEVLKEKVASCNKTIFFLKQQLAEQKAKNQKLEADIEALSGDMASMSAENSSLLKRCEYINRLVEEIRAMKEADSFSLSQEFISTKQKCDKYKNKLLEQKENFKKLVRLEIENETLAEKLQKITAKKHQKEEAEHLAAEERATSYFILLELGRLHISAARLKQITVEEVRDTSRVLPSKVLMMTVLQFLGTRDKLKLVCLSRESRGLFLRNPFLLSDFLSCTYKQRVDDYKFEVQKQQEVIRKQDRNLTFLSEQDSIRNKLMADVSDEGIKAIIGKYIVKPKKDRSNLDEAQIYSSQLEQTVQTCENFLQGFVDLHYKKQKLEAEEEAKARILQQEQAAREQRELLNQSAGGDTSFEEDPQSKWSFNAKKFYKSMKKSFAEQVKKATAPGMTPKSSKKEMLFNQKVIAQQINSQTTIQEAPDLEKTEFEKERAEEGFSIVDPSTNEIIPERQPISDMDQDYVPQPSVEEEKKEEQPTPEDQATALGEGLGESTTSITGTGETETNTTSVEDSQPTPGRDEVPDNVYVRDMAESAVRPLIHSFDDIRTVDQMNSLMMQLGEFLVPDKPRLSKWIQGVQQGFAQCFVEGRELVRTTQELEILKEFMSIKIEQLQLRVHELLNEKEDLQAIEASSSGVKEHLIAQINDMEQKQTTLHSELLLNKQRVQELEQVEAHEMEMRAAEKVEIKKFKKEVSREVKALRKESQHLRSLNSKYQKSLIQLKLYMEQIVSGNGRTASDFDPTEESKGKLLGDDLRSERSHASNLSTGQKSMKSQQSQKSLKSEPIKKEHAMGIV